MALPTALPFGIRDIKIMPYATLAATALPTTMIDLPNIQTASFTVSEEFTDLEGDDNPRVTSHGQGATGEGTLESGGLSLEALAALDGGTIVESGTTPNQVKRYVKNAINDVKPFFLLMGQAISDSGGDLHTVLWLCRATGDIEFEESFGEFMVPSIDFTMYQCRVDGDLDGEPLLGRLFDFVQNETVTALAAPEEDV